MMDFISGAFSGFVQNMIGFPLDTIKVLQQNKMSYRLSSPRKYYCGFSYPLVSTMIHNSIVFKLFKDCEKYTNNAYVSGLISGTLYSPIVFLLDSFKIMYQTKNTSFNVKSLFMNKGKSISFLCETSGMCLYFGNYKYFIDHDYSPFIAGGISGLINWSIGYPIDVIKTRQITYNISIKEAIQMGSFHKGLPICLCRAFLVNSFGFYSYERCEYYLSEI